MYKLRLLFLLSLVISTLCLYNVVQLTCAQKKAFVDGHNLRRFKVAQGLAPGQPPARDMKVVIWDEELAQKAASWASHGIFGHNPDRTIGSNRWDMVGENIYLTQNYSSEDVVFAPDIEAALDGWYFEHENYKFEPFFLDATKPQFGHYTQMVWADSTRMGCGISQKVDNYTETLFVCNYGPTGNFLGKLPYAADGRRGFLRCASGMHCGQLYGPYC